MDTDKKSTLNLTRSFRAGGISCRFFEKVVFIYEQEKQKVTPEEAKIFFKTVILQQKVKYTYGYKFNGQRMERQKILLPVNEAGSPAYDYMEQYGKQLMLQKYREYLDYISA